MMPKIKQLPPRAKVKPADTWDLSSLFPDDDAWEKAFSSWEKADRRLRQVSGKLGDDAKTLAACLKFDSEFDRAGERLGTYAFLKTAEDTADSTLSADAGPLPQRRPAARPRRPATSARRSWPFRPRPMKQFLAAKALAPYRLLLERLLRYKPHTLGKKKRSCWPCRPRWPRPPTRSSAN